MGQTVAGSKGQGSGHWILLQPDLPPAQCLRILAHAPLGCTGTTPCMPVPPGLPTMPAPTCALHCILHYLPPVLALPPTCPPPRLAVPALLTWYMCSPQPLTPDVSSPATTSVSPTFPPHNSLLSSFSSCPTLALLQPRHAVSVLAVVTLGPVLAVAAWLSWGWSNYKFSALVWSRARAGLKLEGKRQ